MAQVPRSVHTTEHNPHCEHFTRPWELFSPLVQDDLGRNFAMNPAVRVDVIYLISLTHPLAERPENQGVQEGACQSRQGHGAGKRAASHNASRDHVAVVAGELPAHDQGRA